MFGTDFFLNIRTRKSYWCMKSDSNGRGTNMWSLTNFLSSKPNSTKACFWYKRESFRNHVRAFSLQLANILLIGNGKTFFKQPQQTFKSNTFHAVNFVLYTGRQAISFLKCRLCKVSKGFLFRSLHRLECYFFLLKSVCLGLSNLFIS